MRCQIGVLLALLSGSIPVPAWGQVESKLTFITEHCYKAEISAIAGVDAGACLIFDTVEQSGAIELKLCGGFYFDDKFKLFGVGGGAGLEAKACLKYELKVKAKSKAEAVKLLEEEGQKALAFRASLLKDLKRLLLQQPDAALSHLGITREQVQKSQSLKFEKVRDKSNKSKQIEKIFEKCPSLLTPKDVS